MDFRKVEPFLSYNVDENRLNTYVQDETALRSAKILEIGSVIQSFSI